jgi:hypothetical protein
MRTRCRIASGYVRAVTAGAKAEVHAPQLCTKFWFFVCVEVELGAVNIDANLRVGCAVNLREWVLAFTRLAFGDSHLL